MSSEQTPSTAPPEGSAARADPAKSLHSPSRKTFRISADRYDLIDGLVDEGIYPNRSKAIREDIGRIILSNGREPNPQVSGSKKVTLYVPDPHLDALETLVDDGVYPNVSTAVRDGIESLVEHLESQGVIEDA